MSLQNGQVLFTKDGRVFGNAIVVDQAEVIGMDMYVLRTDFGNHIVRNFDQIETHFYTVGKDGGVLTNDPSLHLQEQLAKLLPRPFHEDIYE